MPTPPLTPLPDAASGQLSAMQSDTPQDPTHDLLICAMHFIGDGMALHTFANEFFGLLDSDKDDAELRAVLDNEWQTRWGNFTDDVSASRRPCSSLSLIPGLGLRPAERAGGPDAHAEE